ncbi:TraR/DksA C4-type zinc finger protein [Petroclostridium sp. X23]|uniref:TraR/DksA C4-type zinc finger protein n=1 Tax=Petroclostridium sp. X23 TaxID=3045146 RepID=UPI0024ACF851|nr:TraR/DksA C4-type zinc finger protein [Petroclostridium sp. X23]WHH59544.1 TraR/DksA C4-type zinc finger protein [Petroclostridium sp. X23]
MDRQKLDRFKKILREEKEQHDRVLNDMKKFDMGDQDRDSAGELSNYDNHPGELGTQLFQLELNMGLEVSEEHQIKEIHDALTRIEKGTYGKCELCGKEIDEERLEVIPSARLCIDCEEDKEIDMEYLMNNRPVEEKVIDAPFGRKYLNEQEDDEYEGMDQLNDVMKYGSASTPQDMGGYHDYEEYYSNEDDQQGIVDPMDNISNEQYEKQLPD